MKKLALIIKLFIFFVIVGSCHSQSKSTSKNAKNSGGINSSIQSSSSSSSNEGENMKKDTLTGVTSGTAIIHGEPNEAQIDSIKRVKTKNKK